MVICHRLAVTQFFNEFLNDLVLEKETTLSIHWKIMFSQKYELSEGDIVDRSLSSTSS